MKDNFKRYLEDKTHESKKVQRLSYFLRETKERYQRNRASGWGEETTSRIYRNFFCCFLKELKLSPIDYNSR